MPNAAAAAAPAPAPAEAPEPAPRKSRKKLLLIGTVLAAALAAVATAVVLLLKRPAHGLDGDELAELDAPSQTARDPKHAPVFAPLEPFTVNLADRDVERYAQITLTLELADSEAADQVKVFMPAVRNNILMVLAHKTSTEILGLEGKTQLAAEVRRATSRALGVVVAEPPQPNGGADGSQSSRKKARRTLPVDLPVVAVHFSNFIVQ